VRRIEAALVDWPGLLERTRSQFERISPRFDPARQAEVVAAVIAGLPATPAEARKKTVPVWLDGPRMARALRLPELSLPDICEHVAAESGLSVAEVGRRVEDETRQSGLAVGGDCQKFDVVPFGHGARMEALYREGVGFAIELMATHTDVARWTMASFAATTLSSHAWRLGRPALRVLALGDGIGMDSARLASLGFDIHYIDFDGSLTSRVARRNLQLFGERRPDAGQVRILDGAPPPAAWDAIVCFEVIEHVPDPAGFLDYLASLLVDGGLLLMSECFDGIQDRWPTHLRGNEAQAGLLPAMAVASGLALHDYNPDPFGKPYVFRKTDAGTAARRLVQQLADPVLVRRTLLAQARVRDDLR
jgi:SAM-dependent methyltransferase